MNKFKPFSDEENQQLSEIEAGFNFNLRQRKLALKFIVHYILFTFMGLYADIEASLSVNISLFKLVTILSMLFSGIIIINLILHKLGLISGDNFITRFLSNYYVLFVTILLASACGGIGMGAALQDMIKNGFQIIDCVYVALNSIVLSIAIYMYIALIPSAIFMQDV